MAWSCCINQLYESLIMPTPDILKKIVARKYQEIEERSELSPINILKSMAHKADPVRGFIQSIENKLANNLSAVIAEIKKASPSKGVMRENFHPADIAKSYQQGGAACLSILTDKDFFQGSETYLQEARSACSLPVIRKDFIIEPYQVYEARAINADCILLIAACLTDDKMNELIALAHEFNMDVLLEVHDEQEMERALNTPAKLLGINNRNLRTFKTSLQTSIGLKEMVKDENRLLVTESGIHTSEDVALMKKNQLDIFLVGEAFMRAEEPGEQLKQLFFS